MYKLSQKGIAHILILIILLIGLVAGFYLVNYTKTNLKPKAYDLPLLTLTNATGIPLPDKVSDSGIHLLLKLPSGWQLPSANIAIPDIPEASLTLQTNDKSKLEAIPSCSIGDENAPGPHMDLTVRSTIEPQAEKGLLYVITDVKTFTNTFFAATDSEEGHGNFTFHDIVPSVKIGYDPLKLIPDGRAYSVGVLSVPFTEDVAQPRYQIAQTNFRIKCATDGHVDTSTPAPSAYPSPAVSILEKIVIKNVDPFSNQVIDSSEIKSNFQDWLNKPFRWRLSDSKSDDDSEKRRVEVEFWSQNGHQVGSQEIDLYTVLPAANEEIKMRVYVSDQFTDQQEVINWAKDTINNYINQQLVSSGINRKVRFESGQVIGNLGLGCSSFLDNQDPLPNTVYLFIPKETTDYALATYKQHKICLQDDFSLGKEKQRLLMHELGHLLGLPDYYLQKVYEQDNGVVPIEITSDYKDIMWNEFRDSKVDFFSVGSREIINRSPATLPGNVISWYYYTPVQVVLQLFADNGLPLPNAKVDVFPARTAVTLTGSEYTYKTSIPDVVAFSQVTDNTGRAFLGDQEHLFHSPANNLTGMSNATALLKITSGDQVRYAAITLSYLNTLYFDQGMTNFATIATPFSSLVKESDAKGKTIQSFNRLVDIPVDTLEDRTNIARHVYEEFKANGMLDDK